MVSPHHNGLNGIIADEMVRFTLLLLLSPFLSCFSRVLGRRGRSCHSSPISSITDPLSVHTLLSFPNPRYKTEPTNSRDGPRTSTLSFLLALKMNVPTLSRLGLFLGTSRSPSCRTKFASSKRVCSRNSFSGTSSSTRHIKSRGSTPSSCRSFDLSCGRLSITGTPLRKQSQGTFRASQLHLPEIFTDYSDLDSFFYKNEDREDKEDEKSNKVVEALHRILQPFLL
jgi:hypothetical protein